MALYALITLTIRQSLLSLKGILFFLLLFFPVAISAAYRIISNMGIHFKAGTETLYPFLMVVYFLSFLLPVATLFFGVSLISDEVEGKTLSYLFLRPVLRRNLLIAKIAGMSMFLLAGMWVSLFATYLILKSSRYILEDIDVLLMDCLVITLGILAYGCLFALLGILLKKPVFLGLLIAFGWEPLVAYLPAFTKKLTLTFHLRTLLPHPSESSGILRLLSATENHTTALIFLLIYTVIFLALGILLIQRKEFITSPEA